MNKITIGAFSILFVLPLISMNAFGEASIQLNSYNTVIEPTGNVLVLGKISGATPYIPVKLTIMDPSGKTIYSPSVNFDGNGNFKYLIKPTLPAFKTGTYTVQATHSDLQTPVQMQFEVQSTGSVTTPKCAGNEINLSDRCMPYSVSGATVSGASVDTNKKSIIITLSNANAGTLNIKPSTEIIKGISQVLIDGKVSSNAIIKGNEVNIVFPAGTQKIEVVGTFVIPEFGAIATIILIVAITGILAVTARYRGLTLQKF